MTEEAAPKRKKGSGKKPAIPGETPEQAFIRLATFRTNRVIKYVASLGRLASRKPNDEQREKVFGAVKSVVEAAHSAWQGKTSSLPEFTFDNK